MPTIKQFAPLVFVVGALAAAGCAGPEARRADPPPITVEDTPDADVVTVARSDQFPLVTVATRDVRAELPVTGVVAPDVSRTVPVLSLASGRVVNLRVRLGDTVRQGQVLLTMSSPDVTQAAADLRKFQADALLARRALDRAHALSDHEALAAKDLEAAVNADEKAQADVHASEERLRLLGADPAHPAATIEMRAPVAGTIVEQNVTGSAGIRSLDNSPNLFTIADLSRVWVLCDIYENNLGDVHLGDTAIVTLSAFPDAPLTATVGNISRVLDPATRTAKVRLEIANGDGRLRPGMFATVVFSAQHSEARATVPATAVMRLHDRDWVFMPDGENKFRRVEVHLGPSGHDGQQTVLNGLHAGDRVVANALQLSSVAES